MMKTYLVTGGAGFIGSHLVDKLIKHADRVLVLDDFSTGSLENLAHLADHPALRIVEGDISDADLVKELVDQVEAVVHLAAAVGVDRIISHPLSSIRSNVLGTEAVLEACASERKFVLLASSSEVYGKNPARLLCEEADSVFGSSTVSRWLYATAKKLDEHLPLAHSAANDLPFVATRFFNIVGPRQSYRYGMVLPRFVRSALAGEPLLVHGDGRQTRNFTYIDDCIEALCMLLECTAARGEIVNVGAPGESSILDLANRVKHLTGSDSPVQLVPYAQAFPEGNFEDMRARVPCACKIQSLTGWLPRTSLDEMITATIRYHGSDLRNGVVYEASGIGEAGSGNGETIGSKTSATKIWFINRPVNDLHKTVG